MFNYFHAFFLTFSNMKWQEISHHSLLQPVHFLSVYISSIVKLWGKRSNTVFGTTPKVELEQGTSPWHMSLFSPYLA